MCLAEQLFFSVCRKRGRTLGCDPGGGAAWRTEAALSLGVPGGDAGVLNMQIVLEKKIKQTHMEDVRILISIENFC